MNPAIGGLAGIVVLTAILEVSFPLLAAEETIVTDRPDFVESSATVGRGRFQIETSVSFERDENTGVRSRIWSTPTLLRLGTTENVELRLETDGYARARTEDPVSGTVTQRGYVDLDVGVKWHLIDGVATTPSVGVLAHASLDSGSAAFRGEDVRPSLRLVMEWELPHDFALGVMPGVAREKDAGERYWSGILGVVLGKEISERMRIFAEVAAHQLASDRHGGNMVTLDFGAAYLLSRHVQLDTALFLGTNEHTPDTEWTLGLSLKF